jgi:hypothetical protein
MIVRLIFLVIFASSFEFPLKQTRAKRVPQKYSKSKLTPITLASTLVENYYNLQYSAELSFGTPSQSMTLTLDTGSSYTWVPGTVCNCHESLNSFEDTASSTFKNTSAPIALYYGMGEVKGYLVNDTLSLGDLSAKNQQFVLINYDKDLDFLNSDGLLGLGFSSLSDGVKTFVDNLKSQGQISESVFSFYISNSDNEYQQSVFTIGEYDTSKYGNGYEQTIEIDSSFGFWLSIMDSFSVDTKVLNRRQAYAIFDLGSSLISVPNQIYKKYTKMVEQSIKNCYDIGYLVCDCVFGDYLEFPDLTLNFNGEDFIIHAENYIYYENGYCYLLVDAIQDSYYIIGQPFFREYYTVFDMDKSTILVSPAARQGEYDYFAKVQQAGIAAFVLVVAGGLIMKFGRRESEGYDRIV